MGNKVEIVITGDASTAVAAAQQTATAHHSLAKSVGVAADEASRYNDVLRQMAIQQKVAEQAQRGLADESDRYQQTLERLAQSQSESTKATASQDERLGGAEAKAAAAQRLTESKNRIAAVDKEIADGIIVVSEEEVKAAEKAQTAGSKSLEIKSQLRQAVKGLALEFPGLARVASVVLNPITLAVAGIAGAFSIWETRMKNAMQVLGGVELPDIKDDKLKTYEAAASAWERFADNVRQTVEAYNSVIAASERLEKGIDKQAEREKKRLDNQKKIELGTLEMNKGGMSDTEYSARRAAIEGKYERGEMAIEERAEQRKLAEKGRRIANLEINADRKEREARSLNPPSERTEAKIEDKQRAAAEAAKKEQEAAEKRLQRLQNMRSDAADRAKYSPWYLMTYGVSHDNDQAQALEKENIERQQRVIDQYNSWQDIRGGFGRRRARRDDLLDDAAKERGAAYTTSQDLAIDNSNFNQDRMVNRETLGANNFMRSVGVASTGADEADKLQAAAVAAIESGRSLSEAMIQAMNRVYEENNRTAAALKQQISILDERTANQR